MRWILADVWRAAQMEAEVLVRPGSKLFHCVALLAVAAAAKPVCAEPSFAPTGAFLQVGAAESTESATAGLSCTCTCRSRCRPCARTMTGCGRCC